MLSLVVLDCESKSVKRRWDLNKICKLFMLVERINFVEHFNLYSNHVEYLERNGMGEPAANNHFSSALGWVGVIIPNIFGYEVHVSVHVFYEEIYGSTQH